MRRLTALLSLAVAALLLLAGPAAAQETTTSGPPATPVDPVPTTADPTQDAPVTEEPPAGEESIGGTIFRPVAGEREPVPDVRIVVTQDGEEVGEGETNNDGIFEIEVPGPGTYDVELVEDTLPEGVTLRNPDRNPLTGVEVRQGQAKKVLFPLGERVGGGAGTLDRIADLVAQGVRLGSIVALAAVGLSLVFGVTGLVNFAHGELVTFGALVAFFFSAADGGPGIDLVAAAVPAVLLAGLLGGTLELGLWKPLRRRRTGNIARMVVSIGLALLLRHVFLVLFGASPRPYVDYTIQRPLDIGPFSLPPKDWIVIAVALGLLLAVGVLLRVTRTGTALRAVADNKDLAESSGIDVERIILITWVTGTALAGLAGVLFGTSEVVSWDMGFTLLLTIFAAVILGGLGTAYGAMVGGLVIGVASETSTYWFSVEFKQVVALGILITVLLVRPQGILGVKERIG